MKTELIFLYFFLARDRKNSYNVTVEKIRILVENFFDVLNFI